jgi:hypothetical protein
LIGWFIVLPLKGLPAANGWVPAAMLRFLVLNLTWGVGVSLILPLLHPRRLHGPQRAWDHRRVPT